jgi:SPP1 family phage portal protein
VLINVVREKMTIKSIKGEGFPSLSLLKIGGNRADTTTAETPVPLNNVIDSNIENLSFGRRKIVIGMKKTDFESGTQDDVANRILAYLPNVLRTHAINAKEIDRLYNYYRGIQPILKKEKPVRPEINHKVVENHAYEIVEFKKSYIYGEPVQYVQKGTDEIEKTSTEITKLNGFMELASKATEDRQLAEWQYICGTAYRFVDINKDKEDKEDIPFELSVPDPRRTYVVYSNEIKEKPLFCGYISYKEPKGQLDNWLAEAEGEKIINIYTDKYFFEINGTMVGGVDTFQVINQQIPNPEIGTDEAIAYPLVVEGQRIIEYPLNNARIGLIELVESILNAINQIRSNDLDGIDQFVQSLLVFINQEVEPEKYQELIKLGAIEISSSDPAKPADVKLLVNQLKHSETKLVIDDLYMSMLAICGIPVTRKTGSSGGDTGQARQIGEGWTMADARAKQDELVFSKAEKVFLKIVLAICKEDKDSDINSLKVKDVLVKFTRNKNDNLLVKTQGLMNLKQAQVDPETAFATIGLFSDPTEVTKKSKNYYGNNFWTSETESENTEGSTSLVNEEIVQTKKLNQDPSNLPYATRKKE